MSHDEYRAKNYPTPDTPPTSELSTRPKKKRKKNKTPTEEPTGLIIAEKDDPLSLGAHSSPYNSKRRGGEDEDSPLTVTGPNPGAEFRKKKKSGWRKVGAGDGAGAAAGEEEQEEADRILASAAREARENAEAEEDAPAMVS